MQCFDLGRLAFILESESLLHHHCTIDRASETQLNTHDLKPFIDSLLPIFSAHHIIECAKRASVEFAEEHGAFRSQGTKSPHVIGAGSEHIATHRRCAQYGQRIAREHEADPDVKSAEDQTRNTYHPTPH